MIGATGTPRPTPPATRMPDDQPADPSQTIVVWALSIINFILMVTLSFMLGRMALRLYFDRRANREGSRIKTKLVLGAMGLSFLPVFFSPSRWQDAFGDALAGVDFSRSW